MERKEVSWKVKGIIRWTSMRIIPWVIGRRDIIHQNQGLQGSGHKLWLALKIREGSG